MGIIDSNGKIVATPKYDYYLYMDDEYAVMIYKNTGEEKEFYDVFGNKLEGYQENFAVFATVAVFVNTSGEEVFGYFDSATGFSEEGLAIVTDAKGRFHTLNKNGEIISTLEDDSISYISMLYDGMAKFKTKDGFYGYVNDKLETVIEPQYTYAENFSEGMAVVSNDICAGYIDKSGQLVIDLTGVDFLVPPAIGFLPWYYYDDDYCEWQFSDGLAYLCIPPEGEYANQLGYTDWKYDENDELIYDLKQYEFMPECYYIDKEGNRMLENIVGSNFVCGLAAARDPETGKAGYVDKNGKFVIQPQFVFAFPFNESGIALVFSDEFDGADRLCGYVNTEGELVIPMEYVTRKLFPKDFEMNGIVYLYKGSDAYCFRNDGTLLGVFYDPETGMDYNG